MSFNQNLNFKGPTLTATMETIPNGPTQSQQLKVLPSSSNIRSLPVTSAHGHAHGIVYQSHAKNSECTVNSSTGSIHYPIANSSGKTKDPGIHILQGQKVSFSSGSNPDISKVKTSEDPKSISVFPITTNSSSSATVVNSNILFTASGSGIHHLGSISITTNCTSGSSTISNISSISSAPKRLDVKTQVIPTSMTTPRQIGNTRYMSLTPSSDGAIKSVKTAPHGAGTQRVLIHNKSGQSKVFLTSSSKLTSTLKPTVSISSSRPLTATTVSVVQPTSLVVNNNGSLAPDCITTGSESEVGGPVVPLVQRKRSHDEGPLIAVTPYRLKSDGSLSRNNSNTLQQQLTVRSTLNSSHHHSHNAHQQHHQQHYVECSPSRKRSRKQHLAEIRSDLQLPSANAATAGAVSTVSITEATDVAMDTTVSTSASPTVSMALPYGMGPPQSVANIATRLQATTPLLQHQNSSAISLSLSAASSAASSSSSIGSVSASGTTLVPPAPVVVATGEVVPIVGCDTVTSAVPVGLVDDSSDDELDQKTDDGGGGPLVMVPYLRHTRPALPFTCSWKPRHNHFLRHTDVRPKKDSTNVIHELVNQKGSRRLIVGWKLTKAAMQCSKLREVEDDDLDRINIIHDLLVSSYPKRDDVNQAIELIEGIQQRKRFLIEDIDRVARSANELIEANWTTVSDIVDKYKNKRPARRK